MEKIMILQKGKISNFRIRGFFALLLALLFISGSIHAEVKGTEFKYSGTIKGKTSNATAKFSYMKRVNIWNLSMRTYNKKTKESYGVNIFFSRKFTPGTGTFPIAFSYLNKKDTCGGSFIYKEKNGSKGFYSHDTKGSVTFKKFSDKVQGTFQMEVYDREGKKIEVSGSFILDRNSAFRTN